MSPQFLPEKKSKSDYVKRPEIKNKGRSNEMSVNGVLPAYWHCSKQDYAELRFFWEKKK